MLQVQWVYSTRKHNHQMEDEAQELFLFRHGSTEANFTGRICY